MASVPSHSPEDVIVPDSSTRSRSDAATRRWVQRLERFTAGDHSVAAFCAPTVVLIRVAPLPVHTITVELALLQHMTLLLGHPIFTLSILLFTLLAASGIGSAFSSRVSSRTACLAVAVIAAIGAFALPHIVPALLPLLKASLQLPPDAFRFLEYHGHNDENHLQRWLAAVELVLALDTSGSAARQIIETARRTAALYLMQFECVTENR
jgi:hypothetical protein